MDARHLDLSNAEDECGENALGRVRRALDEMAPGDLLEIVSSVAEHAFVVRAWSSRVGASIVDDSGDGSSPTRIVLRREAA